MTNLGFDPAILNDPSPEAVEMKLVVTELIQQMIAGNYDSTLTKLPAFRAARAHNAAYQGRLVLALAAALSRHEPDYRSNYSLPHILLSLIGGLLRGTIALTEADYLRLFACGGLDFSNPQILAKNYYLFPTNLALNQVAKLAKANELGPPIQAFLKQLRDFTASHTGDGLKTHLKAQEILNLNGADNDLPIVAFATTDPLGQALQKFVTALDPVGPATRPWLQLLQLWKGAAAGQPTIQQRQQIEATTAAIGPAAVRAQGAAWLELVLDTPVVEQTHTVFGSTSTYLTWEYLTHNLTEAKGLVWTMTPLADDAVLAQLTALVAKCFRKIPGKGPIAVGLGNAGLLALAQGGLPGVAALAQVRSKIHQSNTLALIARYIAEESARLGVSPDEIEDLSLPDFGLENGRLVQELGDYTATLTLAEGKVDLQWHKEGKLLKSAPAALKASHPAELKALKDAQTQAQQTYIAQREHFDRSFVDERRIAGPWFAQYYLHHGLLSELAQALIWRLYRSDGSVQDAMYQDSSWQNAQGHPVLAPTPDTEVQLWHPVLVSAAEVQAWRTLLEARQLRQPLKQAFREVYLFTPPEELTSTYSNRMAAHLLKQHQFNSLAKIRGWQYRLLGNYDKGYETEAARRPLPALGLVAEYWVREVSAEESWNPAGIYHYISTDQVRFVRGREPVPLPEIPPLVFSEVMRDVDLFVGVASVGNDPQWRDNGGLVQYRTYWENYSFGDLGEVAKNRKLALERLVPRLKIGRVSEIKGNFLVVKGTRRVYKIHLGSGNILMEPNDQYLCIVPDLSAKILNTSNVFLPFEDDAVLSIILSKALLLMEDDKITDKTILRQL